MSDDGYHAPPVDAGNVVYPKTWDEAYQHLLRKVFDPMAPAVSFRDLPKFEVSIDEIVAANPMTAKLPPEAEGLFEWVPCEDGLMAKFGTNKKDEE